jgi:hypothetical protein
MVLALEEIQDGQLDCADGGTATQCDPSGPSQDGTTSIFYWPPITGTGRAFDAAGNPDYAGGPAVESPAGPPPSP